MGRHADTIKKWIINYNNWVPSSCSNCFKVLFNPAAPKDCLRFPHFCVKLQPHPCFIVKLDFGHCPSHLTSWTIPFFFTWKFALHLILSLQITSISNGPGQSPIPWGRVCFSVHLFYPFVFNALLCLLPIPHGPSEKAMSMCYSAPAHDTIQINTLLTF